METVPLILVVGGDALTDRVHAELIATAGHDVRLVWPVSMSSDDALLDAGVARAAAILTLSADDALNLAVALRARMLNPAIRVVLRQFDPILGTKIEQNLADCTALSASAHSAATYAAAALDPACFFGLRFPAQDGPLLGFTRATGAERGVAGLTVIEAERVLSARIIGLGERSEPPAGAAIAADDVIVSFGRILDRAPLVERRVVARPGGGVSDRSFVERYGGAWHRINPVLRTFVLAAVAFFAFDFVFFHIVLHKSWTAASFYVVETMTNVGFGETSVTKMGPLVTGGAIAAMLGGIVFTSIFIGYVSSALTRAQWIAMQGLRRVRARGHVVVCGGGKIGSAVIALLTAAGKHVVVIEPHPDAGLIRRARGPGVDLLTGDAQRDDALDLCDIPQAAAILALTDNDAINVEIALSARARCADIPLVVRMENDTFARAVSAIFGFTAFSPSALTAPALAGLSRFPGTRGRVRFARDDYTISQRKQTATPVKPPADICTPLCVWRGDTLVFIRDFAEMQPYDDVLFVVPLGQFRASTQVPSPAARATGDA